MSYTKNSLEIPNENIIFQPELISAQHRKESNAFVIIILVLVCCLVILIVVQEREEVQKNKIKE